MGGPGVHRWSIAIWSSVGPLIFTAIADALQWVIQKDGARWIFHYIDDFITIGEPESDKCVANMTRMQRIPYELGLPIEEKKTESINLFNFFLR